MTYKNNTLTGLAKRVAVRRDPSPNDPYTARKAARDAAKSREQGSESRGQGPGVRGQGQDSPMLEPAVAVVTVEYPDRAGVSNR